MREVDTRKSRFTVSQTLVEARTGLFRATLLFGSIAAALSLIVVPAADRHAKLTVATRGDGLDPVLTGSIVSSGNSRYVVRRSVLQASGSGPCLFFPDGRRRGEC